MPEESAPHQRTWMQWPAYAEPYDDVDYLHLVRQDIARLARTIAQYEEVFMLARPEQVKQARHMCGATVIVHAVAVDDMWARDSGPTFVVDGNGKQAIIDFNFNGWGNKQAHGDDTKIAAKAASLQNISCNKAKLITEGGAIEVDGEGTVLTTESSLMNDNRNPGLSKAVLEEHLNAALGTCKVIWLPGIRDQDITDGHIDGLARFIRPGLVLVEMLVEGDISEEAAMVEQAIILLRNATDAHGR
ncbi:MAG: agmatine deiminase family protein, partial [Glaciimonas sp.]|nr:agmatine deiminase family protein [Glaciimonas sp.]